MGALDWDSAPASSQKEREAGETSGSRPQHGEERKHALLSASSSHRWLECTPSAVAETAYPESSSTFAEEGTLAHAYCAKALKQKLGLDTRGEDEEIAQLDGKYWKPEMPGHVNTFVSYVWERYREARRECRDARLLIEHRLDYSYYVPDGFGTGDAVIVTDGRLEIIDFKYGKGVKVNAVDNPQMKLYALGAIDEFSYGFRFQDIRMAIVQPRICNLSEWETTEERLFAWADAELWALAKLASIGKGARHAGEWCRFCRAKPDCAMYDQMQRANDPRLDFNGIEF